LERAWLADRSTALWAVFIAWAWQQTVLAMILYLAGLTTVPDELVEAARVDGATRFQVFARVVVPLLRPVTTVVLSLIAINSLRNFDLVFAMTSGGPARETETVPLLVHRVLFRELEQGRASAISMILFAMLPLARPALAALATLQFTFIWNDFLYPLVFTTGDDVRTVMLGLLAVQGQFTVAFGTQAALAVIASVPTVLIFIVFQQHFVRGLLASAVKG